MTENKLQTKRNILICENVEQTEQSNNLISNFCGTIQTEY